MYVTSLEQQSFCHAVRKNLKFKLLYFQNKECYPAENKQADGNLYFLLCDEDKNPKFCLVMNFSFLWRHVKTKNRATVKQIQVVRARLEPGASGLQGWHHNCYATPSPLLQPLFLRYKIFYQKTLSIGSSSNQTFYRQCSHNNGIKKSVCSFHNLQQVRQYFQKIYMAWNHENYL